MKKNIDVVRNELKSKLKSGKLITKDDIQTAMTIVGKTGHTDDRVLFAKLKYAYKESRK